MRKIVNKRPTIGVLAGIQVYYGTILGNFIGPLLYGAGSAAENCGCNLLSACGMDSSSYTTAHPAWPDSMYNSKGSKWGLLRENWKETKGENEGKRIIRFDADCSPSAPFLF